MTVFTYDGHRIKPILGKKPPVGAWMKDSLGNMGQYRMTHVNGYKHYHWVAVPESKVPNALKVLFLIAPP